MKLFTKLGLVFLMVIWASGMLWAQNSAMEIAPNANNTPYASKAMFDLQFDYAVGVGGGEAGIETDGINIYTSKWNGAGEFMRYGIDGTYITTITVAGATGCRDIAYDGTYFYGGAASTTIFEMDLANAAMISTFTGPAACRAVAYNEDDDAFYCNNWSDNITKFNKAGANLGSFPVGASAASYYGLAYQGSAYCSDGPYLWGYSQTGATQNQLIQISLPSGAETGLTFDVGSVAAVGAGIAGGLAISSDLVSGYWTILGTSQNVDIWGLELCGGGSTASMTEDDFESYTAGGQLACQGPSYWTTWSNLPCDATEDAYVSDIYAYSGNNSVVIVQNNDLVKNLDTYLTSGAYTASQMVYIPTGKDGYYNAMSDFDGAYEWGFEVYFNVGGDGTVNGGGTGAATFNYSHDTWIMCELMVDLDSDWAEFYLDGALIHGWQWTLGAAAGGAQLQLAAFDFFGATSTTQMYFDDFLLAAVAPPPLDPPTNLTASVSDNDVTLNWTSPGGGSGSGQWVQWDAGTNTGNGIGLTSGGTFYCAAHWTPAQLAAYDGQEISMISFFPNADPAATFALKAWTGASAGTLLMTQAISSYTVDMFNEIDLTSSIIIDASTDLWIGYSCTHGAGTFPAGCDDGPAVAYGGDMISLDGTSWVSMSTDYGLDYNWNIAAYVLDAKSSNKVALPIAKLDQTSFVPASFSSAADAGLAGNAVNKFVPNANKALLGFNVYRDGGMIDYTTATTYIDMDLAPATYDYYVTAVYDEGESDPSNSVTATITGGTSSVIFEDDFESYNVGDQLACSNSAWTTWSNTPCSTEDPFIVDNGGSNVVEITGVNDCVYAMPNYTSGFYTMTFDMYIPTGFDGYFNTLQSFAGASSAWGMQAYFYSGAGSVDAGGAGAATFIYPYDTWMAMQVDVDLDADWAEFFIDGTLIVGWQWSTGTFGTGTLNQLGGNNFYAGGDVQAPKYHIDNYVLEAPGTGPVVIFEDDFEAYTAGQQVACQNPTDWTTWSNLPCDATEDAYISDAFAYSGNNSAVIAQNNDLVKNLDTYLTSGLVETSMMVYIPTGWDGYYNAMSDFDGGYEWGFEVYFNLGGDGSVNGGATGAATFTYNHDVWMLCELNIDLDADLAEFYIDGTLIHSWQWTLGAAGGGAQLQLAAFDFFGATATTQMYFDDFMIQGVTPAFLPPENVTAALLASGVDVYVNWDAPSNGTPDGYNVYRNGANIDYVAAPTTDYTDMGLSDDTYEYCVTAVYGGGESNQACADPVTVVTAPPPGPTNLQGPATIYENHDVNLTWDVPGNDWIQWDAGTNSGNGIGLTNGGTFNVSAHWTPAQLVNYNGLTVTQMSFFPNADAAATFVLKAWTGAAGNVEIMSQVVTSFNVDQFNEVVLTSPFVIDGSTDLWIGYAVTHGAGTFPAGCDDGPAVPYNGDMINLGGAAWVSMSTDYGLDYNWNLAAYVEFADGKTAQMGKVVDFGAANGASVAASGSTGEVVKFVPSSVKDFINFKIYRKYNNGSFTSIGTSLVPSYTDAAVAPFGVYQYYVTALWDDGESNPSNTITVDVLEGIEDILFNSTQIFPNPATDVVNIKSDFTIESVTVYNYAGQAVVSEAVNNKIYQVNTSEYQAGIYFFQIDTKEGRISKRVIIK